MTLASAPAPARPGLTQTISTILSIMLGVAAPRALADGPPPAAAPISARSLDWQPLWPEGRVPGPTLPMSDEAWKSPESLARTARPEYAVITGTPSPTPRPALICFPGGGYGVLSIQKEGVEIAQWAAQRGMVGVVLKYRVSGNDGDGYQWPVPLWDAQRAVATIRHRATELGVDPGKIGVIGFSAGGHLTAMTAVQPRQPTLLDPDAIDAVSARPDFAALIYPVIAMDAAHGHSGSRRRLLGENPNPDHLAACCPAKRMTNECPPLFLAHAADDWVPLQNSLDMAAAAAALKVPVTLHVYPDGGHGFGMRPSGKTSDAWPEALGQWVSWACMEKTARPPK